MKIINTGFDYRIYGDGLQVYDKLPPTPYSIVFNPNKGFSLSKMPSFEINEKLYGVHKEKAEKVFDRFSKIQRNLGIILSGDKGIGKSLFAKLLATLAEKNNIPTIVVDTYIPGIADFINSIEQEVLVMFDEFDKTFGGKKEDRENAFDPQTEMLSLFDGLSMGKKLFVITCNDLSNVSGYLVNRPGRFHYHFRFEYPDSASVTEYLTDKGIPSKEIEKVVAFSNKVKLNYDCLRSIAFELQFGEPFEEVIKDLNIVNMNRQAYNIFFIFKSGKKLKETERLDLFDEEEFHIAIEDPKYHYIRLGSATIDPTDLQYEPNLGGYVSRSSEWNWGEVIIDPDEEDKYEMQTSETWKNDELDYILIRPIYDRGIHYKV